MQSLSPLKPEKHENLVLYNFFNLEPMMYVLAYKTCSVSYIIEYAQICCQIGLKPEYLVIASDDLTDREELLLQREVQV